MLKYPVLFLILFYKKTLSHVIGKTCCYTPTCSMYCFQAVQKYGGLLGILLGAVRILRCHPLCKGGFDPVKENFWGSAKWTL